MKEFLIALKDNLSNLFSIIGIVLTIYFSVYYVPEYSKEIEIKKIEGSHKALIGIVQELVYNDHMIDQQDIETLIHGKELKQRIIYPYTINELLIQTQESFLDNKFIPLEQRKKLVEKIDEIRGTIKEEKSADKEVSAIRVQWLSFAISVLGVIASVFGLVSVWSKIRAQRILDVDSKIERTKEDIQSHIRKGVILETLVYDELRKAMPEQNIKRESRDTGLDFLVRINAKKRAGVEVKYTETALVPVRTISQLIAISRSNEIPILLVTNAPLTPNAAMKAQSYNEEFPRTKIDILVINSEEELHKGINLYFNASA